MGIFDLFRRPDIDAGVREYEHTVGGVLLDVRTEEEYAEGHIPGSRNVPLAELCSDGIGAENRDTPVYVYCLSGGRSRQAAAFLRREGYTNVKDLGGIAAYSGKMER